MESFNNAMMHDSVWFDRVKYEQEVENYQLQISGNASGSPLVNQIAQARANIKQSFKDAPAEKKKVERNQERKKSESKDKNKQQQNQKKQNQQKAPAGGASSEAIKSLEKENQDLKKLVADLTKRLAALEVRVTKVEKAPAAAPAPAAKAPAPAKPAAKDDDDSDDLFGDDSDEEEEEETPAEKAKREKMEEQRKKAMEAKAKPKKVIIAKSEVVLDVKPWDDETNMKELEDNVRSIAMDGLVWGGSKMVPVGYGINKLRITCVVEDEKVSTDDLEDKIVGFEDHVQSMDIFAFNKI